MIVGTVEKQPSEIFPRTVDFANELASGETLSTATVTAHNAATGTDSSAQLLQGSPQISAGSKVTQTIKGGGDNEHHVVQYRVTSSAGQTLEAELVVHVREVESPG